MTSRKDKEKNYPQLRFPGFTDAWEQRKLSDAVDNIGTGKSKYMLQEKSDLAKYEVLGSTSVIGYDENYDHEGDFILTARVGANAGNLYHHSGKVKITDNTVFIQGENLAFVYNLLTQFDLKKLSFGTGQPLVKASELKNLILYFPNNDEQAKIGSYFKQLDHLITLHQRKLAKLKKLKQGYLQKMFPQNGSKFPQLRFAGFADAWEQRKFSELFQKSSEKNTNLSFSRSQVLTGATMTDSDRDINSDDDYMKTYNVIHVGDILFEGHTSKQFAFGRFVLDDYRDGIVSHVFDIYRPKAKMNLSFWKYYIHDENVMRPILVRATSNARMLNALSSSEFLKQSVFVPSENEQAKIGNLLEQIDSTIALHQRKLEKLQELKKVYLQKMFC